MIHKAFLAALFIAGIFTASGYAQSRPNAASSTTKSNQRPDPRPTPPTDITDKDPEDLGELVSDVIRIDTGLVTIPVRVIDRENRFIGGLQRTAFKVFENGVEQSIAHFSNESQPFTVALVLDMSYSATFKITDIQSAAMAFISQLRPADRVSVISFDEEVHVLCPATTDRDKIFSAIRRTKISTGTSLYEAVDQVVNSSLKNIEGRKAMVLFTDGVDTTSRGIIGRDNLEDVLERDILIYPIRYDTFADVQSMKNSTIIRKPVGSLPTPKTFPGSEKRIPFPAESIPMIGTPDSKGTTREEYERAEEYLEKLADHTGGRIYMATTFGNLNDAFAKIASELREFYSLGYYPAEPGEPGSTRNLRVQVDRPNVAVRAKKRYVVADPGAEEIK